MTTEEIWPYTARLATFRGLWDDALTAARQLAAIGHICDRPPLESLDDGSRCITCGAFVKKELSVRAFGEDAGTNAPDSGSVPFHGFRFHHPQCKRLQVRVPLERGCSITDGSTGNIAAIRAKWEARSKPREPLLSRDQTIRRPIEQRGSFFSLPPELRLEIYALVLPHLEAQTVILPLNRDSSRLITQAGAERTRPRDPMRQSLLQTCRTVHAEALDLLYARTTFTFTGGAKTACAKTLFLFLRGIGCSGRALIQAVDVNCGEREDAIAFALLGSCPSLRVLTLRIPRPTLRFTGAPLWVTAGVECLLALRGLDQVRFESCASTWRCMEENSLDAVMIRERLTQSFQGEIESEAR